MAQQRVPGDVYLSTSCSMSNPQESFVHTTIGVGSLIHARRRAVSRNTLLYQLEVLKKTGRYDAFNLKWHPSYSDPPDHWPIPNHLFWDSDVGKWIEGACYFLLDAEEKCAPEIQKAVDELVDMIESAQQPDGYLNIHYTVVAPGLRFTNLRDMHELYNCGHLIEAALAHHDLAGRDSISSSKLLNTMLKYVKLLCQLFGPDSNQIHGYPGHPEIELALLRLYKRTSDPEHLRLAQYFLTERGQSHGTFNQHFYTVESERRGEDPHAAPSFMGQHTAYWYHQAHLPIVDQPTIEGHSVRAMYLLTAAADLCSIAPRDLDTRLRPAIYRLWTSMVSTKMYVTGGIGAIKQWEGFGLPHFLPQSSDEGGCYAETCAAIGVVMLAERLLQIELDGSIADVMELAMYNALLVGMSDCGRKFAYHNQLASCETNPRGVLREEWFTCACCPPNVLRFLAMIGGYVYSRRAEPAKGEDLTIDVHLFISSSATWTVGDGRVVLKQESSYPWRGAIEFSVDASEKDTPVGLNIRIPAWAKDQWIVSSSLPCSHAPSSLTIASTTPLTAQG